MNEPGFKLGDVGNGRSDIDGQLYPMDCLPDEWYARGGGISAFADIGRAEVGPMPAALFFASERLVAHGGTVVYDEFHRSAA